jgi:hypothetical protein
MALSFFHHAPLWRKKKGTGEDVGRGRQRERGRIRGGKEERRKEGRKEGEREKKERKERRKKKRKKKKIVLAEQGILEKQWETAVTPGDMPTLQAALHILTLESIFSFPSVNQNN